MPERCRGHLLRHGPSSISCPAAQSRLHMSRRWAMQALPEEEAGGVRQAVVDQVASVGVCDLQMVSWHQPRSR